MLHLYCAFSIWICSKAHYNDQFTPSRPKAHIGASGSRFNAVHVCWCSFYRPRKDGKLNELQRERRSHRYSTLDKAGDWTWDLQVGRQRSYHCANPSASRMWLGCLNSAKKFIGSANSLITTVQLHASVQLFNWGGGGGGLSTNHIQGHCNTSDYVPGQCGKCSQRPVYVYISQQSSKPWSAHIFLVPESSHQAALW